MERKENIPKNSKYNNIEMDKIPKSIKKEKRMR